MDRGTGQRNKLELFIEDSGPGVPAELQQRIFEPFISTKPSGTGLGLAISYDICGLMQATYG